MRDRTKAGQPYESASAADLKGSQKVLVFSFMILTASSPSILGDSPRQMRVMLKVHVEISSGSLASSTVVGISNGGDVFQEQWIIEVPPRAHTPIVEYAIVHAGCALSAISAFSRPRTVLV